jgi:hypothetical protein
VEVDEALVDAHLVFVESDGTLTTRGLVALDGQLFGGKADGALHLEALPIECFLVRFDHRINYNEGDADSNNESEAEGTFV